MTCQILWHGQSNIHESDYNWFLFKERDQDRQFTPIKVKDAIKSLHSIISKAVAPDNVTITGLKYATVQTKLAK